MDRPTYNPKQFSHWTQIKVRFSDLDPLNHVNNSVYNTYLEEARIDFIQQIPEFNESMAAGKSFILVHLELDYIKPVRYNNKLLIGSAVEEYGNSSIKGFQAIYSRSNYELKAVAKTTGVWFDLKSNRPVKLPELHNRDNYRYQPLTDG
jgi:acyl-CoA thioester hydrolase